MGQRGHTGQVPNAGRKAKITLEQSQAAAPFVSRSPKLSTASMMRVCLVSTIVSSVVVSSLSLRVVQLEPLALASGVAEVIRAAVVNNVVGDLLPLHFG